MGKKGYILKTTLIAVLFSIANNVNYLQARTISFEHINRDNGLPVNSVTCIAQDNEGFIWIGSLQGLIKYNGYSFKTFTYTHNDSTGIPGHLVTKIICHNNGLIYLSQTDNGFSILNPKTELFENYRMEDPKSKIRANINDFVLDKNDDLWLGSNNGLLHFNSKTKKITKHNISTTNNTTNNGETPNHYISALTLDNEGNLYILGYQNKVIHFNTTNFVSTPINYTNTTNESIFVFNAGHLKIYDNKLWIESENNGIFIYDLELKKTTKHILKNKIVSDIVKIDNKIWIAIDGDGVYITNKNGQIEDHLTNNPYNPFSISSNAVYSIFQSLDKTIWVGCYSTGINIYNASRHKFNSISEIGKQGRRLTNKSILCIEPRNDSTLFIGTDGGGINILNTINQKTRPLKSVNNVLDNMVVKTICFDSDDSFYIGTFGYGMFHCQILPNGKVKTQQIERKQMGKYKHVWHLHKGIDNTIWVGYLHSGLSLYNTKTNSFTTLHSFDGHNIHIIKNIDNQYWVSSEQKGINICNKNGEIVRHIENDSEDIHSLSSNFVLEIFNNSKGQVWLGTNTTGLNLMQNHKIDSFIQMNNTYGFPANMITNIEEDANGFLWVSTDKGLVRYNPETHNLEVFDKKDGLQGKKFNINCSHNDKNKTFYFGGTEGLSYFHPYMIERNNIPPQITLTELQIDNKPVYLNDTVNGRVILHQPIEYTSSLNLSHKDDNFTIGFSALHFESSSKNSYKYKLEGFDNEWIDASPENPSARYTNLNKGNFVFKIMAANADNIWNTNPLEININIKPPFYLTTWFYLLFSITITLLVIFIIRIRTKRLNQAKINLEAQVKQRTKELELKAQMVMEQNHKITEINEQIKASNKTRDRIFSIIAHDLKNPLGAIISFSSLLFSDFNNLEDDEKKNYISIIRQTSVQMNGLILNLLFWANNQIGKIKSNPNILSAKKIFAEVEAITEANSIHKNQELTFHHNNAHIFADSEMLITILRNLVANSVKFTPEKGHIKVEAFMEGSTTTITVKDSGTGMTKDQIIALNKNESITSTLGTSKETGTGLGLLLCKDFTQKNNGTFSVKSSPNGTCTTLTFPAIEEK